MTHLRPYILECFSCYGKIDQYYVESPAKCALPKSRPLTLLNHPIVLLSLTPIFLYSLLLMIFLLALQPFLLCSLELSFHCKYILFYPQISSQNVYLLGDFSPKVHSITEIIPTPRGNGSYFRVARLQVIILSSLNVSLKNVV